MATIQEIMGFFETGGSAEEIEQRTGTPAGEVQSALGTLLPGLAGVQPEGGISPISSLFPSTAGLEFQQGAAPIGAQQALAPPIPGMQQPSAVQQLFQQITGEQQPAQPAPFIGTGQPITTGGGSLLGFQTGGGGVRAIPGGGFGAPAGGGLVAQPGAAEEAAAREAQRFQQAIGGLQAQQQAIGQSPLFQAAGGFAQDVLGGQRLPIGAGTQAQILQQFQEANIERAGAQQGINRLLAGASGLGRGGDLQARQATSLQNLARQQGAAQRDVAIQAALANFQAQQQAATQARQVAGTQFGLQQPFVQQQAGELIARREVVTPEIAGFGGGGLTAAQQPAAARAALGQRILAQPGQQPIPAFTPTGATTGFPTTRVATSTPPVGFGFTPTDVRRR